MTNPTKPARHPSLLHLMAWASLALGAGTTAFSATQTEIGQERMARVISNYERSPMLAFLSSGHENDVHAVMAGLEAEIDQTRDSAAAQAERLSALESALGPFTGSIAPAAERAADVTETMVERTAFAQQPIVLETRRGEPEPEPVSPEIASAEEVDVQQAAPLVAKTSFAVEIAAAGSLEQSSALWQELSVAYPQLFARLEPSVVIEDSPAGGVALKVVAGPISNAAEAASVCAQLKRDGRTCAMTVFAGQKLAMR